jgi:hypothetical protein
MLPVTRVAIARIGRGLPDKHRAANPIRQTVPLSGQAEPGRPLTPTASRNRPALGASSNEGDRGGGTQSNRAGWLRKVWKGQSALPDPAQQAPDWRRRRRGAMPPKRPHANLETAGEEFA